MNLDGGGGTLCFRHVSELVHHARDATRSTRAGRVSGSVLDARRDPSCRRRRRPLILLHTLHAIPAPIRHNMRHMCQLREDVEELDGGGVEIEMDAHILRGTYSA